MELAKIPKQRHGETLTPEWYHGRIQPDRSNTDKENILHVAPRVQTLDWDDDSSMYILSPMGSINQRSPGD